MTYSQACYRFLQVFALGTWLGAIIFLSFVVAPGAFASLTSRDQAGRFVGLTLARLHVIGMIAGMAFLVVALLAEHLPRCGSPRRCS